MFVPLLTTDYSLVVIKAIVPCFLSVSHSNLLLKYFIQFSCLHVSGVGVNLCGNYAMPCIHSKY